MTYLFFSLFLGDRYWYENDIPPSSFTKDQLNEIRKSKLAQVICENIPSIDFVQPNAFLESDPFLNALMPCRGETILHTLNLNAWATGKIFAYLFWFLFLEKKASGYLNTKKVKKLALNSQLLTVQILTNDVQVLILCLSYFFTTVTNMILYKKTCGGLVIPKNWNSGQ